MRPLRGGWRWPDGEGYAPNYGNPFDGIDDADDFGRNGFIDFVGIVELVDIVENLWLGPEPCPTRQRQNFADIADFACGKPAPHFACGGHMFP